MENIKHVDEFIDSFSDFPEEFGDVAYAQWVLFFFRLPDGYSVRFAKFMKLILFCDYLGKTYRVTGASRFGDVWPQPNLSKDHGYTKRGDVMECRRWRATPEVAK